MASGQDRNFGSVKDFLASLDLLEYLPLMESEGIDLDSLTEISEDDLLKLGINKMGHRKKILKQVKRTLLTVEEEVGKLGREHAEKDKEKKDENGDRCRKEAAENTGSEFYKTLADVSLGILSMLRIESTFSRNKHMGTHVTFSDNNRCCQTPYAIMPIYARTFATNGSFF